MYFVAVFELLAEAREVLGHLLGQHLAQPFRFGSGGGPGGPQTGLEPSLEAVMAGGPKQGLSHPVHGDFQAGSGPQLLQVGGEAGSGRRRNLELFLG